MHVAILRNRRLSSRVGDAGERRRREKYTQGEEEKVALVSLFLHHAHAHAPRVLAVQASLWLGLSHFDPKITCSTSHSCIIICIW